MLKIICPKCGGNGYLGGSRDADTQTDCDYCNSQGEVDITEETVNYGNDKDKGKKISCPKT